jgi:DNA-binding IclR family transcriptional regulator
VTGDGRPDARTQQRASNVLTSTQKTLALMETIAATGRAAGVSELARLIGSSRGTVHKQLSTLVASGWVEQHADGRYGLSLLVARMGNAALRQAGLGEKLQAVLNSIVAESGECASIAVLYRHSALIVQRAESDQVLSANIQAGTVIPLTSGASSLVLLAFAMTSDQRMAWREAGVEMAAERRIAAVRDAGFAFTCDEFLAGVTAVSIPVQDELTLSTTALTLVGPNNRVDVDKALHVLVSARDRLRALGAPKHADTSVV